MQSKSKIIAVDFDGTCVKHKFPKMGEDVPYCVVVLKELVAAGHQLILFTMRSDIDNPESNDSDIHTQGGQYLSAAFYWFVERSIPLYGINTNPDQHKWTHSPKPYANIYIDDAALGCPLIDEGTKRPYVNWVAVREALVMHKIL